jgi:hypothetical protein
MQMIVDLYERARLMDELQSGDIRIALPVDMDSVMLACLDPGAGARASMWVPIHIVVLSASAHSTAKFIRAAKPSGLLIARMVYPGDERATRTFAFTPSELLMLKVLERIERARGELSGTTSGMERQPTAIERAIEPFALLPAQWRQKLAATIVDQSGTSRFNAAEALH